jgi:hypothetical protein
MSQRLHTSGIAGANASGTIDVLVQVTENLKKDKLKSLTI